MAFCLMQAVEPPQEDGRRRVRCIRPGCGRITRPTRQPLNRIRIRCRSPLASTKSRTLIYKDNGELQRRWFAAQQPVRPQAEVEQILDSICGNCEFRSGEVDASACQLRGDELPLREVVAMSTERCPIGKWRLDTSLITACITTYKRPRSLERLLASIQRYYPSLAVDVENTKGNLSRGRNRLVDRCQTPFYLMLEDDFEFTDQTNLEPLLSILMNDYDLAGVGGHVCESEERRHWCHNFDVFRTQVSLHESTYPWRVTPEGVTYRPCHAILNFGLFRREALAESPWDEDLPLSEHREWYYGVWRAGKWRMAFTPATAVAHHRDRPEDYAEDRRRNFEHVAEEKHGVRFRVANDVDTTTRPNIVVLGVGHANTSITTRQIAALGWNLGDADDEFAESVSVREINQQLLRQKLFDQMAADRALARLPRPWVVKDPRFVSTLSTWLPVMQAYRPLLLWITKDSEAVKASYQRRGYDGRIVEHRERQCEQLFADWPWTKLHLDASQVAAAAVMFDAARHASAIAGLPAIETSNHIPEIRSTA